MVRSFSLSSLSLSLDSSSLLLVILSRQCPHLRSPSPFLPSSSHLVDLSLPSFLSMKVEEIGGERERERIGSITEEIDEEEEGRDSN